MSFGPHLQACSPTTPSQILLFVSQILPPHAHVPATQSGLRSGHPVWASPGTPVPAAVEHVVHDPSWLQSPTLQVPCVRPVPVPPVSDLHPRHSPRVPVSNEHNGLRGSYNMRLMSLHELPVH